MNRRVIRLFALSLLSLFLMAARWQEGIGEFLADRWWIWLIVLSVFLLISFFLVLGADWTQGRSPSGDEQDDS